jgi:hypothetical protein
MASGRATSGGTDESSHAAWVPEEFIEKRGEHDAVLLRDYDSSELAVVKGDEFDILDEAEGWYLCRMFGAVTGWVPQGILERSDGQEDVSRLVALKHRPARRKSTPPCAPPPLSVSRLYV